MAERIHFQIDDNELVEITTKLDKSTERIKVLNIQTGKLGTDLENLRARAMSGSNDLQVLSFGVDETMGRLVQLDLFGQKTRRGLREIIRGLPTLKRSQRLIATQLPMVRQLLMGTYRLKMMAAATTPVAAAIAIIYIVQMIKQLDRIQKQMLRDMQSFEDEVRRGLDLTHKEFMALDSDIIGYATLWEQLTTRMDEAETTRESWDAIADFVISKIGRLPGDRRPPWIPPGAPRPPEPEWLLDMKRWWENATALDTDYDYNANIEVPPGE